MGPVSMYAEINDPSIEQVRRKSLDAQRPQSRSDSRAHSRTGSQPHSEPRSSPIDPRSGTPHEGLSSDEMEPGNAMYAQVDFGKKRESRKRKEEQKQVEQQQVLNIAAIDSWV